MVKILLVGDPHGRAGMQVGTVAAQALGCEHVIFLGDCWDLNVIYDTPGVKVHAILGNHEDRNKIAHAKVELHHDFTSFVIDDVRFGVVGRIDPISHLSLKEKMPWLHQAVMNSKNEPCFDRDRDMGEALIGCTGGTGKLDVLLTHDAIYPMNFRGEVVGSQYLTDLLIRTGAKLAFHGHMHEHCQRTVGNARVFGLDQVFPRGDMRENGGSFAVLDTKDLTVTTFEE